MVDQSGLRRLSYVALQFKIVLWSRCANNGLKLYIFSATTQDKPKTQAPSRLLFFTLRLSLETKGRARCLMVDCFALQ